VITVLPTDDVEIVNRLANHPDIAPHVRDDSVTGTIDLSSLCNGANVFLLIQFDGEPVGFVIMVKIAQGIYEQHSGILAAHRGREALHAGNEVLRHMFRRTDCMTVVTWAWVTARHVRLMARFLGFTEQARELWPNTVNGLRAERVIFTLTLAEWAQNQKGKVEASCQSQPHSLI